MIFFVFILRIGFHNIHNFYAVSHSELIDSLLQPRQNVFTERYELIL